MDIEGCIDTENMVMIVCSYSFVCNVATTIFRVKTYLKSVILRGRSPVEYSGYCYVH